VTIQIADPRLVAKIEQLAEATGLSTTAAVEQAVDKLIAERGPKDYDREAVRARFDAILSEIHSIPDRPDAFDPLEWDENGLPK